MSVDIEEIKNIIRTLPPTLLTYPVDWVALEEFANLVAERLAEILKPPRNVTRLFGPFANYSVGKGLLKIVEAFKPGKLNELVAIAPSNAYNLVITIDDTPLINQSWDELSKISAYSNFIDAFQENDSYILRMAPISWRAEAHIQINAKQPITFKSIFAAYELIT